MTMLALHMKACSAMCSPSALGYLFTDMHLITVGFLRHHGAFVRSSRVVDFARLN